MKRFLKRATPLLIVAALGCSTSRSDLRASAKYRYNSWVVDNSIVQIDRAIEIYNTDTLDRLDCRDDFPRLTVSPGNPRHAYIEMIEGTGRHPSYRYSAGTRLLGLFDFNESEGGGQTRIDTYLWPTTRATIGPDVERLRRIIGDPTRCPD